MTLRRQLVAAQLGAILIGLVALAAVSYHLYSDSQYQRIDSQLQSVSPLLGRYLAHNTPDLGYPAARRPPDSPNILTPGSFIQVRSATGTVLYHDKLQCLPGAGACPTPELPAHLDPGPGTAGRLLTVGGSGGGSFRVLVRREDAGALGQPDGGPTDGPDGVTATTTAPFSAAPGTAAPASAAPAPAASARPATGPGGGASDSDVVITAIPSGDVVRSLHRLLLVDAGVGAVVLLVLSAAGLFLVRRGLRPLERMATTARTIAGGDLSVRAAPAGGRSEVGQLGLAFNTMMGSIEGAFAERNATEERLRQFLADASHELRTPLTSIRGYAELYRLGAAADRSEVDMVIGRIEEHAQAMSGLVEELLLLARLDETRPPERTPVDLTVLAAEVCGDVAVTAPDRRLVLDAAHPVSVVGDADHLRRAMINLLTNAVRHTPATTPVEVTVSGGGGVASVVVRDHGPGLSPDGLAHAFDRFWRADPSRTGGGAGLGLAIVAGVAAEHAGQATVTNAPDGGAVFSIRLPVPLASAPPPPPRALPAPAPAG